MSELLILCAMGWLVGVLVVLSLCRAAAVQDGSIGCGITRMPEKEDRWVSR